MLERGYGRIINIASLTTFVAFHEVAAYGASKAAVGALTKSLAIEWGAARRDGQRDRAGRVPDAAEPGAAGRDGARARAAAAHAHARASARSTRWWARRSSWRPTPPRFVNGHILAVDGGFLASGVNQ